METIWLSPTGFVTGDPTLQISYPFVSHPGTVVTCTAPGDLKWVSMGLRLPPNAKIEDVIAAYEVSSPKSFISEIRLAEMKTPDHANVLHADPTPLQSTIPASYTSHVGGSAAEGAVTLELRLNFNGTTDEIRLGAVGVTFQLPAEHCVNVRDFGAKGDGVTDDTAAIQAAVTAIPSSGGTICFPVGTYKIAENITFPANISAAFDHGATLAPASGVTVTMNSEVRAGLYQIFTTGAGLIRGFSNAPFLPPQWWGAKADGAHDDGPAIQAILDAVPDLGGTIMFSSGHYVSSQGFIVKARGTTITGLRAAYSYEYNRWGTQVEFKGGTTGFDFCLGLAATDPNYLNQLRSYCKISQLVINGGNTLQNGIRMASANLIEEVNVFGCTNAGILLDQYTNQVQINKCCATDNHIGLYAIGASTTIWSCKQSNWRENDVGVRIEGGAVVEIENCVIESNGSYGMEIYAPASHNYLHHLNFKSLWFENNCFQSSDRYALYIHSDTTPGAYLPTNIRFEQSLFSASSDTQSCINIQRAQFVTFDECVFYCDNPDRDIVLGTDAVGTSFKNCTGLPADIATKGTNTVNNSDTRIARTGLTAPASGSNAVGDIVWNNAPSPGGNIGWVCVTAGTPGEWKAFGSIAT